jgi:cell division protease FtsH
MAIKDQPNPPRFRLSANLIFFIVGLLFLGGNFILPSIRGSQIPGVPYSLFIHQVQEGEVARVQVGQSQIRYQLKDTPGATEQVF